MSYNAGANYCESIVSTESSDDAYEPSSSTKRRLDFKITTHINVDNIAVMSDKAGVSDRATATIATAVLEEAGLVNELDTSKVIDKNKIRRAKKRMRSKLSRVAADADRDESIKGIYFDGRKDTTKIKETVGYRTYVKCIKEEHVSLIQEPGSEYLGHITPITGSARNVVSSIMDFFHSMNIDTSGVIAVGCDGTAVNTGKNNGIIRLLEEKLGRPLHWFICLLHMNELPLRHLINQIDGKTTGPATFEGSIGRMLPNCESREVVEFIPVNAEDINVDSKDLSTDQKYLLQIYRAISSGHCPQELALKSPGKMHHARWLTTANRILRCYISEQNPSSDLVAVVGYIMKVYVPAWFHIKMKPSVFQGAKHLHKIIAATRSLDDRLRGIINKVLQNNSYFAHHENLLLAMTQDESGCIRELGYRRILKARQQNAEDGGVRRFAPPKLLLDATVYHQMIDWQAIRLTEPPATRNLSDEKLKELIQSREPLGDGLLDFPCHTQAVERIIKLVTDASGSVVGEQNRDGFIRARIEGRKRLPTFESKKDYTIK
jgi:hypothetical protein